MSLQKNKVDGKLGAQIHRYLAKMGVETPGVSEEFSQKENSQPKISEERIKIIEKCFQEIMTSGLGLDLSDDSLHETPSRVAKMYINEIFWGLNINNFPKITTVENKMSYDEMVIEDDISVQSNCEHHLVIIQGFATIAYIPNKKVLGLSKLNRVVEYFSKRPQIQERLTEQVFHALSYILETDDIAVVIDAEHFCVKSRGVEDINSHTITSKLGGSFKTNPALRAEFMNLRKK